MDTTVQLKVLEILAVKLILVLSPLQIVFAVEFVSDGAGFTVTVIETALPAQPCVEVGVTI
jgi:hypothetical protein